METGSQPPAALYDTIEENTTKSSEGALTRSTISQVEMNVVSFDNKTEVLQSGSEAPTALIAEEFLEIKADAVVTEENVAYKSYQSSPLVVILMWHTINWKLH